MMLSKPGDDFFQMIRALVARTQPIIIEIGANDGTDTAQMLEVFPGARIYAFEPDPRAAGRFKERFGSNRSVTLTEAAIGRSTGRTTFYQSSGKSGNGTLDHQRPDGWDCSGSIRPPKKHLDQHPWCRFETQIETAMYALDDWMKMRGLNAVDFVWADVQGAEQDLIAGALETLPRARYFFTEYSNAELYVGQIGIDEMKMALPAFDVYKLYEGDVLFRNKSETRLMNRVKNILLK